MIILGGVLRAIAGVGLLYTVSEILTIISGERAVRSRFVISALASVLFDFTMAWGYNDFPRDVQAYTLVIVFFHFPFLVWFSRKHFRLSHALIAITLQEFCDLISLLICIALPEEFSRPEVSYCSQILVVAAVLTTVMICRNKLKEQNLVPGDFMEIIPKRIYAFTILSMFFEAGMITILRYEAPYIPQKIYSFKVLLFFLITTINAIILITLIINVVYKKCYGDLNKILKRQVDSQLRHYEKREALNHEIRSFRHDFNDHIKCLEAMMALKKYDEAKAYLESLSGMMPSGDFLFRTGNYIADAILTEIQETNRNVTVKFQGFIPENMDSADLCAVLSNAMNNAAEACSDLTEGGFISVYGDCRQGVFVLSIKNSTTLTGHAADVFPKTSKPDKASHGFGLSNIQRIVKKYSGTLHTLLDNGCFTLSLTMSVIQAEFENKTTTD